MNKSKRALAIAKTRRVFRMQLTRVLMGIAILNKKEFMRLIFSFNQSNEGSSVLLDDEKEKKRKKSPF